MAPSETTIISLEEAARRFEEWRTNRIYFALVGALRKAFELCQASSRYEYFTPPS
jgi:hypothetical protein